MMRMRMVKLLMMRIQPTNNTNSTNLNHELSPLIMNLSVYFLLFPYILFGLFALAGRTKIELTVSMSLCHTF